MLTGILAGLAKHPCAATVEDLCHLGLVIWIDDQRLSHEMVSGSQNTVLLPLVHVGELLLHLLAGEHGDVLDAQGLEDIFLKIRIQL